MSSQEIRRNFLNFFKERGHTALPSSSVVPFDDPTLLFINAGMNQFKDVFLGKSVREYTKATTAQKCIRVGGKHNDLENVGHTSRHLTFFEMLGNFSFGDYFKKEAIAFAWDLTLNVFQFEEKKIWATVFYEDEEAFELWKNFLPEERIVRMGEKDNFWAMGDTGPCGPCSELYFDRGEKYSHARSPAEDIEGVRFLEFWNLVFMEFNRGKNGEMHKLPKQSVDTGAGLERILSLKMETESLFETDILRELIAQVEAISGKKYLPEQKNSAPFRVIADHLRTLAFAIADGVQPSNIERGYVLRKVLRRAVRYGRQIELNQPFLSRIVPKLVDLMGEDFPELRQSQIRISEILTLEEENFFRTLKRGGNLLNQILVDAEKRGEISGEEAFKLKDTYGLPLEEIVLLAKDAQLNVDINRFEELESVAKMLSRGTRKATHQMVEDSVYSHFFNQKGATRFLGYDQITVSATVLGIMKEGQPVETLYEGEEGIILLDQTPFYAEKGGQIGDQGEISYEENLFDVIDCQNPFGDLVAHIGIMRYGEIRIGSQITAAVDSPRRQQIARNHTATHLLHWALRQVLGLHIKQAGSVVEPTRLRFDFNHHKALSTGELEEIENRVNEKIRNNRTIKTKEVPFSEVQTKQEIIQFFGEKYGNQVRVVDIEFSKELCGGTHLHATGEVGYFRIVKEGSIAAGVRRVEAVTGFEAEQLSRSEKKELRTEIELLSHENKQLKNDKSHLVTRCLTFDAEKILSQGVSIGPIPFFSHVFKEFPSEEIKECADIIMKKSSSLVLLLIGQHDERCSLFIRISSDWIQKGIHASDLIKAIAPIIGGKGGGKSDAAQGGGTNPLEIPKAIDHAKRWLEQKIF